MIIQTSRPQRFCEVAGQETVVNTLKSIVKNPDSAPKSIILQGGWGCGKTTNARIFAKALNCEHPVNGDCCGHCSICTSDISNSMYYEEYDSAIVGNTDTIKELRDSFYFNSKTNYKIVVLDEAHLMSPQAQSALLKVLEEVRGNIFFVLCTTDAQKLLPTIRSRSLELFVTPLQEDTLIENLKQVCVKENLDIDDSILKIVARRSRGHVRDAHMMLDRYKVLGKDDFLKSLRDNKELFLVLFLSALKKNKDVFASTIYKMLFSTMEELKSDYEDLILDIFKAYASNSETNQFMKVFIDYVIRQNYLKAFNILNSNTVLSSFDSDKHFQAAMWVLYVQLQEFLR